MVSTARADIRARISRRGMMQRVRIRLRRRLVKWRRLAIEWQKSLILALLPFFFLVGGCGTNEPFVPERVIFILVDTLRADYIGSAGGPVPTPHLDRLAAEGQLLTRAVASFNVTSMSMGAIFSIAQSGAVICTQRR